MITTPESCLYYTATIRPIGQLVSTSDVNVSVPVHLVGEGLNEPARFSEQAVVVKSGHASRNASTRLTLTESVTPGNVSQLSTSNNASGSRQCKRTLGNASSVENTLPRRVSDIGSVVSMIDRIAGSTL
ncbi:hypothetical protein Tco_0934267, partial [Tanacetum coccineum]